MCKRCLTTRLHPTVESLSAGRSRLLAAGEAERYAASPRLGQQPKMVC